MTYRLSRQAEADLDDIYFAGARSFGLLQAQRYADGLARVLDFLAAHPRAARLRSEIDPPIRAHPYRSHLIVYEVDEQDEITILRVRHGREDWSSDPL